MCSAWNIQVNSSFFSLFALLLLLQKYRFHIWGQLSTYTFYYFLFKLIKICCVIGWNKYSTYFFFHFDPLLPTPPHPLSLFSLHWEARFSLQVSSAESNRHGCGLQSSVSHQLRHFAAAAATFSHCMRNAGMIHTQIFHVSCRPSDCRLLGWRVGEGVWTPGGRGRGSGGLEGVWRPGGRG